MWAGDFAELWEQSYFPLFLYFKINSSISRKLKGIACFIHEKYHKTAKNIVKLWWLVRCQAWLKKITFYRQKQVLKLAFYRPDFWQIIYSTKY